MRWRPGRLPGRLHWGLAAALALGALLRLSGMHWDASVLVPPGQPALVRHHHVHPDERFLTMVTAAIEWPDSWNSYLDSARSPANPRNQGFPFFSYGMLPVFLTRAAGDALEQIGYDRVHLVGRALSALFDLATVALTFALGRYLYGAAVGVVAALLLSMTVLHIQLAHFYAVDTFAAAFATVALLSLARIAGESRPRALDYGLLGVAIGAGVACKAPIALLAIPAGVVAIFRWSRGPGGEPASRRQTLALLGGMSLATLAGLAAYRVLDPYAFQGPGLLGLRLEPRWVANMREIRELSAGLRDVPSGHQWADRTPLWFPWLNMVTVGMGPALGVAAWGGWLLAGWQLWRRTCSRPEHLVPWVWVLVLFLYQGTRWVTTLRYFLPIYPPLILFAAYLIVWSWRRAGAVGPWRWAGHRARFGAAVAAVLVVGGTFAWAWAFTSIYRRPHSRVEASRWIYAHVPLGSALATEHWDDALPLDVDGRTASRYRRLELPHYDDDTPAKLETLLEKLQAADYVILSSNRLYDSIPRLPMRYPMTILYYCHLFSGELGFRRVAEFTSYPTLLGIAVPDQWAEEAFSVYDHPRVQIFAKTALWSRERARALLSPVTGEEIQRLPARDVGSFKGGLRLAPEAIVAQERAGTWSRRLDPDRGLYDRGSLANRVPALAWGLTLALLGLLAFPLTAVAFRSFEDRGWLVSKAVGILLVAVIAWLLASWRLVPFGARAVWLAVVALAAVAVALLWRQRAELARFARQRWALLAGEELLFWSAFAAFLWLRWQNPDLWHPSRGGEKPMDFAYLNAVLKSASFPPYDPWFAGGYLNYYYFGFVLTAALVKLTGIVPAVAYNLAVPTFFALTVGAAFTAASGLAQGLGVAGPHPPPRAAGRPWLLPIVGGVAGAVFVAVSGNLTQAGLLFEAWRRPIPHDWWYWNASRAISHPPTETGPITEFPFFSFLFGDLHAHLMALPYTLVVLALTVQLVRQADERVSTGVGSTSRDSQAADGKRQAVALGLLGVITGALWPLNTWDFPPYLALVGAGLVIGEATRRGALDASAWTGAAWRLLAVATLGRLVFHPFFAHFGSAYGAVDLWTGSRTSLGAFLVIHGFFLFALATAFVLDLWSGPSLSRLARRVLLGGAAVTVGVASAGLGVEALLAGFVTVALGFLAQPGRSGAERLLAILALAGVGLSGAVEYLVLRGDIARMNTVFKLYLQVWVIWGVASAASLVRLGPLWAGGAPARGFRLLWGGAGIALLVAALLYPALATPFRLRDRIEGALERGLDGQAFMANSVIHDQGAAIALAGDAAAIRWLQDHVVGTPVIVEASIPSYRWGSRVSVNTGLPTIVGWDWHQRQQRAVLRDDPVGRRLADIRAIYTSTDPEAVLPILRRYRARYIYVGPLEELYYQGPGLAKFDGDAKYWDRVYENPQVRIYRVRLPP